MVLDDSPVGIIEELVNAPEKDEGWDVVRVDLDHLFVGVTGIRQSPVENGWVKPPSPNRWYGINGVRTRFVCTRYPN